MRYCSKNIKLRLKQNKLVKEGVSKLSHFDSLNGNFETLKDPTNILHSEDGHLNLRKNSKILTSKSNNLKSSDSFCYKLRENSLKMENSKCFDMRQSCCSQDRSQDFLSIIKQYKATFF